jgi:hypothetical protein
MLGHNPRFMRGGIAALAIIAVALAPAGAIAMKPPIAATVGRCTVTGEGNLPTGVGGAKGLCETIERTIDARAPSASYTAQVKVLPRSRLSAVLVVNGRELPEQHFAVMDRELSATTIQRFADGLADQVADAAKGSKRRS